MAGEKSLLTVLFLLLAAGAANAAFSCSSPATCQSLAGYVPPNGTTYAKISSLFQLDSILSLFGHNGLPPSTSPSAKPPNGTAVFVPVPCTCNSGRGISDRRPKYTVAKDDTLSLISTVKFGGLITYEEIATVNGIVNPDEIDIGEKVWIPIPCSCDGTGEGKPAVHLAHVVKSGSSLEGIAMEFGSTERELLRVNNMSDPRSLLAGQVLDVPLRACSSSIGVGAIDGSLRVTNGSYTLTARNCLECSCSASSWQLECKMSNLSLTNSSICRAPTCELGAGARPLQLGEGISDGCRSSRCDYAGYFNSPSLNITTVTTTDASNCSASSPIMSASGASSPIKSASGLHTLLAYVFAASLLSL